jgi:outer membrane receptor protein involved in Fe transport
MSFCNSVTAKFFGLIVAMMIAGSSFAQVAEDIEEIVITATKRAQSLQEVSAAVTVFDGAVLEAVSINNLARLTEFTPSVMMSEAQAATNIFIRGVGSGQNYGFEQSVGMFIDGVHYSRARSFRNPFFDVNRVEVLKGPQSVILGKNVVAGAFNITTRRPTEEWEATLRGEVTPEYSGFNGTAVVSGPLSDDFGIRIAANYSEIDGFMKNTLPGAEDPYGREESVLRGTAQWDITDDVTATLKAEVATYDVSGGYPTQPTRLSDNHLALILAVDPQAEIKRDWQTSVPATDDPLFTGLFNDTETDNLTLTLDWDLDNGGVITSVTSQVGFDWEAKTNNDHTNLNVVAGPQRQDFESFAQELRYTSPSDQTLEYLVGAYYSDDTYKTRLQATLDLSQSVLAGVFCCDRLGRNQQFAQDNTSWAVFGEVIWNISDMFRIKLGARYTEDDKTADKRLWYSDASTLDDAVPDPEIAAAYNGVIGVEHNLVGVKRSTDNFSPGITFEWDATSDLMTYLSYTEGFKAGGFDEDFTSGVVEDFEYEDEEVESWALGAKWSIAGGRGYVNAELFSTNITNLQVSTFSIASFLVGNAAEATTEGLDIDARYVVNDSFTLGAAVVFLNAEYDSYPTGPCILDDAGNAIAESCDLSGQSLQYAPDVAGRVYGDFAWPVFDDWELGLYVDVAYTDDFFTAGDNDPETVQKAYTKVNGRISMGRSNGSLSFALVGNNITDKLTSHQMNDIPLAGLYGGKGLDAIVDPPRMISFQAEVRF